MNKKWIIIVISFLVCISGGFYMFTFQESVCKTFSEEEKEASKDKEAFFQLEEEDSYKEEVSHDETASYEDAGRETIQVYICGEVNRPGVYTIEGDKRLVDLVELCQGLTKEAAVTAINLAGKLTDGEKIYIPHVGEELNGTEESVSDGKININTATLEQLMTLPGIGKAKAGCIIAYREAQGEFQSIEELMKVEGIKDGVYSKVKDWIKV